jgi:hypothetical protein
MNDQTRALIAETVLKLQRYIVSCDYAGYDPYDALTSPLFRLPLLRSNKLIRFASQQFLRRLPINLRPLLGVRPGRNPVTYGLCLHAYTYLMSVFPEEKEAFEVQAGYCLSQLEHLQSKNYSGSCWGYDFDWEGWYARIPAFTPTVVATGFITNALFAYHTITGNQKAGNLCRSAADFVMKDLNRSYDGDAFCFSYSPNDNQRILNATMKAARLLVQSHSIAHNTTLLQQAKATVAFLLKRQRTDGGWPYAAGDARSWVDNFHTGYILDCLADYAELSGDVSANPALKKGLSFYVDNFLDNNAVPKYYHQSVYPIDATAGAQTIITLSRFGHVQKSVSVARWMIENMFDGEGRFYYQRHKAFLNRTAYMRWSNAWMLLALSYLMQRRFDVA